MHRWIIGILLTLSLIAAMLVIKFGLNPKPIPIIKASNFEEPEKFSRYIYRQLYTKLKLSPVIAFGTDELYNYDDKLIENFFRLLGQELKKTVSVYSDRDFLEYTPQMSSVKFTRISEVNVKSLIQEIKEDKEFLVVIILKQKNVLHNYKDSLVNQLEFALGKEALSFSFQTLEEADLSKPFTPCNNGGQFEQWLECLKELKARSIQTSKKIDKTKTIGILERVSEKDFLIFLSKRPI